MTNASSLRLEALVDDEALAELERLAGPADACTPSIWKQADLVPEPDAVSIRLDGGIVGRLSAEDAVAFRTMMQKAGRDGEVLPVVQAEIATTRGPGGLRLGISLYLPGDLKRQETRSP
jgi:hypothetical protein